MSGAHWRDSARAARFFMIDARAAFPLLLFLLHIKLWTFVLAVIATLFFGILERYGFTLVVFWRWFRTSLVGRRKVSSPWWR
ncbi:MAG: phosphoesterase [Gammaproteobacteria bacterium CG11_big_fil_rev_8_21_14_0_20_46_22]|nr:MAG: phosphoesterase [Gammaproteobacteria bacterium CG12_big_fil_rev_8_21_14_0_65_46_12]PIR10554.1 MAG: phosphoesterase [Gammaproteobacteria bacterium CG11_big_fil_rev_8_21_14_0_20_46_22]